MDYREIDDLVAKFWAGESTLEEEQLLKEMLTSVEVVPEKYQDIAAYFQAMRAEEPEMELGIDFEEEMLSKIRIESLQVSNTKKSKGVFYLRYYAKVAAILVVGLLSFKLYNMVSVDDECINESDPLACMDTFENPEEAYELLKEQLLQVSLMMNKGQGQMSRISKFDEAQEILKDKNR